MAERLMRDDEGSEAVWLHSEAGCLAGTLPPAQKAELVFLAGGDADAFKLVANGLLGVQVAALAKLLCMSERFGLDRAHTARLLSALPVTSAASAAHLPLLVSGEHPHCFPVELERRPICRSSRPAGHLERR